MSTETPRIQEQKEEMVEATNISTVFTDSSVLEKIADDLMSRGIISGFSIEPVRSGYIYEGEKTTENQFQLSILVEKGSELEEIKSTIRNVISQKWDVPKIEEREVKVNRGLLDFVKRAGIEHGRYKEERKKKLGLALAAFLSLSGLVGVAIDKYAERKAKEAVTAEKTQAYEDLKTLEAQITAKVSDLESKIQKGEPLTLNPNDMAAGDTYSETQDLINTVRNAERVLRKAIELETKND